MKRPITDADRQWMQDYAHRLEREVAKKPRRPSGKNRRGRRAHLRRVK